MPVVVQPHADLAEADLASCVIVPVIEIAFDVAGTPFYKLFVKVSSPCLHFFIGRRNLYLLCKNNHFSIPRFCQSGIGVPAISMITTMAITNAVIPMTAFLFDKLEFVYSFVSL